MSYFTEHLQIRTNTVLKYKDILMRLQWLRSVEAWYLYNC